MATTNPNSTSFREAAWNLSPARLRTTKAAKLVYAFIGLPMDLIRDAAVQAGQSDFPDYCAEDALPYVGRDRGIVRGPREPALSFRARLILWLTTWYGAGVGRAMLDQIAGFLLPQKTRIRIWTQNGVIYVREANGDFSVFRSGGFNWDGNTALWARFWVIIDSVNGVPWSRSRKWGSGGKWGDGGKWGSAATSGEVQGIRSIVNEFKPAQTICQNIIVSFDALAFGPDDSIPPLPDGTWGNPYKIVGGVVTSTRDSRAIYYDGVAA